MTPIVCPVSDSLRSVAITPLVVGASATTDGDRPTSFNAFTGPGVQNTFSGPDSPGEAG